jgi:hypothetical protein
MGSGTGLVTIAKGNHRTDSAFPVRNMYTSGNVMRSVRLQFRNTSALNPGIIYVYVYIYT